MVWAPVVAAAEARHLRESGEHVVEEDGCVYIERRNEGSGGLLGCVSKGDGPMTFVGGSRVACGARK